MIYKLLLVTLYFAFVILLFRLQLVLRPGISELSETLVGLRNVFPCAVGWLCCKLALKGCKQECKHRSSETAREGRDVIAMTHNDENNSESVEDTAAIAKQCANAVQFKTHEDFIENVEDTKACVWLVLVIQRGKRNNRMTSSLQHFCSRMEAVGIHLGTYDCNEANGGPLCQNRQSRDGMYLLLTMPKGIRPKGKVATYLFDDFNPHDNASHVKVEHWLGSVLHSRVKNVATSHPVTWPSDSLYVKTAPTKRHRLGPSTTLTYLSSTNTIPLVLAVLSVKFTGRVEFVHLQMQQEATTKVPVGSKDSKLEPSNFWLIEYHEHSLKPHFHYLDIFLRTLHPETNDLFLVAIFVINLACLLDLFIRDGGPLKRILYSMWLTSCANTVLIFAWLPLLKLFFLPQMLPVAKLLLSILQSIMSSDIAFIIRQDLLEVFQHLSCLTVGFVIYCTIIGYMRYTHHQSPTHMSWQEVFMRDIQDIKQLVSPLFYISPSHDLRFSHMEDGLETLVHYLSIPNLWLQPRNPLDYLKDLDTYTFCNTSSCDCGGYYNKHSSHKQTECPICIEEFVCGDTVTQMHCCHSFHKDCIVGWVCSSKKSRCRTCPVCRWPVYKTKTLLSQVSETTTSDVI